MFRKLPVSTIERLSLLYHHCRRLRAERIERVSSSRLGADLGIPAHTIRKDINFLGEVGDTGSGYDVSRLQQHLAESMGFDRTHKTCIVGLGRLGSAFLSYSQLEPNGFPITAAFDSSINRLETIRTEIPLFPAYEITEIVRREAIEMALLTVPAESAVEAAESLARGGIKGIVNFAPVFVNPDPDTIVVRNMNVVNELRILSALSILKDTNPQTLPEKNKGD
jgi:redox-sensing transcriptional repressor